MGKKVSVISDLCVDMLVRGDVTPRYNQEEQLVDDYDMELGGSAAIFASQYAKLGGNIDLFGLVGNDLFGEYVLQRLEETGVNAVVTKQDTSKTSLGLGLVRGSDRAMLTFDGSMQDLNPENIFTDEFFRTTKHLHICSYYLLPRFQAHWSSVILRLKKNGVTISLDTNWAPDGDWEKVRSILPLIDVFLPNDQEAKYISGMDSLENAGQWLSGQCPLVVIKCGPEGARIYDQNGMQTFAIPEGFTNDLVIADTTGAGDNFDGGFLYQWLQGKPSADCVSLAMRCGTLSLQRIGGIAGQLTSADV